MNEAFVSRSPDEWEYSRLSSSSRPSVFVSTPICATKRATSAARRLVSRAASLARGTGAKKAADIIVAAAKARNIGARRRECMWVSLGLERKGLYDATRSSIH